MPKHKGLSLENRYLRQDKREPASNAPPAAGVDAVRVQPATIAETVRAEEVRKAVGIFDGFVHCNDPRQAHRLNLLVREVLTDETGDFGVRLGPTTAFGVGFLEIHRQHKNYYGHSYY